MTRIATERQTVLISCQCLDSCEAAVVIDTMMTDAQNATFARVLKEYWNTVQ